MLNQAFSVLQMSVYKNLQTGNAIIDAFLTAILLSIVTYFINLYQRQKRGNRLLQIYDSVKGLFWKKHLLILEGKRATTSCYGTVVVSCTFTDRFKAVWENILNNMRQNETILEVRELASELDKNNNIDGSSLFIVSQRKDFVFDAALQIYGYTVTHFADDNEEKDRTNNGGAKIDRITIYLYSYKTVLHDIIDVVNKITEEFVGTIEKSRKDQNFIYTIGRLTYDEFPYERWDEYPFSSARTFDNIFFKEKRMLMDKIKFFQEQREWYYNMGIPYTLGIGLHGPPGTGKTSLIKCIANMTKRHVIVLSLKMLKTRTQLQELFYEDRYNQKNKNHSIDFTKKIIVIEDIDCAGDIVLRRKENSAAPSPPSGQELLHSLLKVTQDTTTAAEKDKDNKDKDFVKRPRNAATTEEPLTLDDLLNLWDGLKETPGRILIISSNHYEDLDPALTRPGRIDVTLEMRNTSQAILAEMYEKFYGEPLAAETTLELPDNFYSPAEVINLYVLHKDNGPAFIRRLRERIKPL